jgi:hypothetical protein
MYMQLVFDLTPELQRQQILIIRNETWIDVSDIAHGVGFTGVVQVSSNLNDELQPGKNEVDGDYDQRLYDALSMSHLKLFLDSKDCATFCFTFPRKVSKKQAVSEISLRVRVLTGQQRIRIGLVQDFSEML